MTMVEKIKVHDEIVKADNNRWNPSADEVFSRFLDLLDGKEGAEEWWEEHQTPNPHGKLIELRWEAYHDVYIYEDGYVYRDYIGD